MRRTGRWCAVILVWVSLLGALELGAWAILRRSPPDAVQRIIEAERLAEPKQPGEVRVFLFGGSTMNGAHFNRYSSPQIWIRLLLKDLCDGPATRPSAPLGVVASERSESSHEPSTWRVINLARDGRGTDEIVARMRRLLPYEPDAFFIYAAHNEGLAINSRKQERATAVKDLFRKSHFVRFAEAWLERGRDTLRALRKAVRARVGATRVGRVKQPTALDRVPPGSDKERRIEANCRRNMRTMYELAKAHGAVCLLSTFVSNEADFAPARSQHSPDLGGAMLTEWQSLTAVAQEHITAGRWAQAIPLLITARSLDPQYAQTAFDLGKCYEHENRSELAQEQFSDAIELDVLPNRDSPRLNDFIKDTAQEYGVPVVDFRERFLRLTPQGLIGHAQIVDNCHLDVHGHYLLAYAFLETLAQVEPFTSRCGWHWERLKPFEEYERALDVTDAEWAETYRHIGVYLGSHFDWAIDAYRKALTYDPQDAEAKQFLVLAYYQSHRQAELEQAMAEMERDHPAEYQRMLNTYPELAALREHAAP